MSNLTASLVLKLTDQASNPLRQATRQTTALNQSLMRSKGAMTQLGQADKRVSSYRNLKTALGETTQSLKKEQQETARLAKEIKAADKPAKALTKSFEVSRKRVLALKNAQQEQRLTLQKTRAELSKAGLSTDKLNQSNRHLARQTEQVNAAMRRQRYELARQQSKTIIATKRQGELNSALARTEKRYATMSKVAKRGALGVTAAGVGVAKMTADMASQMDATMKSAGKLGLHVERLQELDYAAGRSGISVNTMRMALQRSTRRISEAAIGTGEAVNALNELGLSAQYLNNLSPDKQLDAIADAMSNVSKENDQIRLSNKLFDSEGVVMVNMLKDGAKGLKQLREEAQATGNVLDEVHFKNAETFNDRLMDAQWAIRGMKNQLLVQLLPTFTNVFTRLSGWISRNQAAIQRWGSGLVTVVTWAADNADTLTYALAAIAGTKVMGGLFSLTRGMVGFARDIKTIIGVTNKLGGVLKTVFSTRLIGMIGSVSGGLMKVVGVVSTLTRGLIALAVANPITAIAVGIAGAGYLIYKNWDSIKSLFSSLRTSLLSLWGWMNERLPMLSGVLKAAFSPIHALIKGVSWLWNKLKSPPKVPVLDERVQAQEKAERVGAGYPYTSVRPTTNHYTYSYGSYKPVKTQANKQVNVKIDAPAPTIQVSVQNGDEKEVRKVLREELQRHQQRMNDELSLRLGDI